MLPTRSHILALLVALLAACAFAGAADAGWVTIKNDTNKAIVVQEVSVVNGRVVRGKPTKLLAGESFKEFQNTPGEKCYEVYDVAAPNVPAWAGKLNCKGDTQSFSVAPTPQGRVGVAPIPEAKTEPKKP